MRPSTAPGTYLFSIIALSLLLLRALESPRRAECQRRRLQRRLRFRANLNVSCGTPTGQALPTPDAGSLHHSARGRRLCEPGAGAGDRFAAAADRERLPNHRGRGRDCAHGLCGYARIHPVRGRPDGRSVREIPHRRDRERARRRARDDCAERHRRCRNSRWRGLRPAPLPAGSFPYRWLISAM